MCRSDRLKTISCHHHHHQHHHHHHPHHHHQVANRNTASETVRTLLVYGYVLDPPTGDVEQAEVAVSRHPTHRTYRAENTYGVSAGKW